MTTREVVIDGVIAGAVAAVVSGVPSTALSLTKGSDVLEPTLVAGSMLLPDEERQVPLVLAALQVHVLLSLGWSIVIAGALRHRAGPTSGAVSGAAIAVLDLLVIGRRWRRIRQLPFGPQLADHITYGLTVGIVLQRRRR